MSVNCSESADVLRPMNSRRLSHFASLRFQACINFDHLICLCRDVILEKHYRGVTSRASVELFWEEVAKRAKRDVSSPRVRRLQACNAVAAQIHGFFFILMQDVPPILVTSRYYLVNIYRGGLYFLATLTGEVSTCLGRMRIEKLK